MWSGARLTAMAGLSGGMVTAADYIAHDTLHLPRTPLSTLALDTTLGGALAVSSLVRRQRRARKYLADADAAGQPTHRAVSGSKAKNAVTVAGIGVGTSVLITGLAVSEQATARAVTRGLTKLTGSDLGEFGETVGHVVPLLGAAGVGVVALRRVRAMTEKDADVKEAAYPSPPTSVHVSAGPRSSVAFGDIGKEGRRFVLMGLDEAAISRVMGEPAKNPVRVVIPRDGAIAARAALAVSELRALGGFERSLICVASPTGVGYVNPVMAEALEYLTRGDCAVVEPQYALVPSALALNKTKDGGELQRAVIEAIHDEIMTMPPDQRPRIVNFGESLGAQVALDVGAPTGVRRLDSTGIESGLYLGVPFRSRIWRTYREDPDEVDLDGRLILVSSADGLRPGRGRHVMMAHDDDPIPKFGYAMVVQRPWWMGPPETRPPKVPRETLFRPVTTFILSLIDLLNGMNSKPGQFHPVGHDYRFDMRRAIQYAFDLPADEQQAERIESELRLNEQVWAERRLVAKESAKAVNKIYSTLNRWGRGTVEMQLAEPSELNAQAAVVKFLSQNLGTAADKSDIAKMLGISGLLPGDPDTYAQPQQDDTVDPEDASPA